MAVTITDADLASAIGSDTATATRLLAVATEVVTRYAPDAPRRHPQRGRDPACRVAVAVSPRRPAVIRGGERLPNAA